MMKRIILAIAVAVFGLAAHCAAQVLIGAPDAAPTLVDEAGRLCEDWGAVGLRLIKPEPQSTQQRYAIRPFPVVVTRSDAGTVSLTVSAYRAPVWPAGVDVLEAVFANDSDDAVTVEFSLDLPEAVGIGERLGSAGGRAVLALPDSPRPARRMRDWGCDGAAIAMPGWGTPDVECDPAFKNIRAGMGGVPIIYYLKVPTGTARTVVLGLCESFWGAPGSRPIMLYVEGAPKSEIDPLAAWGRHKPGCLVFNGRDINGDGRLQIVSAPHPASPDKNPILNVIWVFSPDVYLDIGEVIKGNMNKAAEIYIDVGGSNDRLLYEGGPLSYSLTLPARSSMTLVFLAAPAGAGVPNPEKAPWTAASLRRAAEDVWAGFFCRGRAPMTDDEAATRLRKELAEIVMNRFQADGYYVALPRRGALDTYSLVFAAEAAMKLDEAGHHADAEEMLRYLWEKPVPPPFVPLAQREDGQWTDATGQPSAHLAALLALARHAVTTGDSEWAARAWPAMKAGWNWASARADQFAADERARAAFAEAREACAKAAEIASAPDDAAAIRKAGKQN